MKPPLRLGLLGAALFLVPGVADLSAQAHRADEAGGFGTGVLPLVPDTVLEPPGGLRVVRLPAPGSPVVALRLSVPVREGSAEAGAARILQMLGTERAGSLARPVGATVEGTRTPWGIAYTVTGASADVDFLAFLLREAVGDPAGRRVDVRQAVAVLQNEAERRQETPGGQVAARLRAAVAPSAPPLGGTAGSLTRLTPADVRSVWSRTHQASRMTLVVAGDVPLEVVLASFQTLGAPSPSTDQGPADAAVPQPRPPRIQVLRHWYGEARPVGSPRDPHAEAAALLVAEHLQALADDFEAEVQLWQLPETRILAVVGAAYASGRQDMRRAVRSILAETASAVTPAAVERAVSRVEADLRMRSRTPAGRADLVGLHLDATGEVTAARDYLASLGTITPETARAFLSALAETEPRTAEVRP